MHSFNIHHHYIHSPHLHLFRLHGRWGLYLNQLFRTLSMTMVGLFVPIYLYEHLGSFDYLFLYYGLFFGWALLWLQPVVFVMRTWGVDKTLMLASLFRAIALLLFVMIEQDPRWMFVVALFYGMTTAFDWLPYHYSVTSLSEKNHDFGKGSSYVALMEKLAGAVGPAVGAVIITWFGYAWLYTISAMMLLLSAVAPLFDDFDRSMMHFDWKETWSRFTDKGIVKHVIGHGLSVFDLNAYQIIWPLILIGGFGTVMKSGLFQSVTFVLSVFILLWMSKYLDKGKYGVMKAGSVFGFSHWWLRYLISTPIGFAVAELVNNLGQVMLWTPFNSIVYEHGAKSYKMEFFYVRQVIRLTLCIVSIGVFWWVFHYVHSLENMMIVFGIVMIGGVTLQGLFHKK